MHLKVIDSNMNCANTYPSLAWTKLLVISRVHQLYDSWSFQRQNDDYILSVRFRIIYSMKHCSAL